MTANITNYNDIYSSPKWICTQNNKRAVYTASNYKTGQHGNNKVIYTPMLNRCTGVINT